MILIINKDSMGMKPTRLTTQKKAMEEEIGRIDHFFSAEDFHERIHRKERHTGIATVYRFLKDCREKNVIFSYTCRRRRVYSRKKISHCHFICEKTGKVIHFDVASLDFLKDKIPGTVRSFQLDVRGVCDDSEGGQRHDRENSDTMQQAPR